MMRDKVEGWQAIERIDVALLHAGFPAVLHADRWISPTGVDATIVSSATVGRRREPVPRVVSCPAVAKDASLGVGQYVVDPQLRWNDLDDRRYLISPALGLRVSVRNADRGLAKTLDRFRCRPCLAVVEHLDLVADPALGRSPGDQAAIDGTYPALLTRWPIPVTSEMRSHSGVWNRVVTLNSAGTPSSRELPVNSCPRARSVWGPHGPETEAVPRPTPRERGQSSLRSGQS